MLTTLFHSLLSLDQTLAQFAAQYGSWLYALLFAIIFAETGLVIFPFLPGDSLLFIAGTVVTSAGLNVHLLVALLIGAAILGDSLNYAIGHYIGPKVFDRPDSRWFRQEHLRRTQGSTTSTAPSRSSSAASCRSCAPSRRSWPAWRACRIGASFPTT